MYEMLKKLLIQVFTLMMCMCALKHATNNNFICYYILMVKLNSNNGFILF